MKGFIFCDQSTALRQTPTDDSLEKGQILIILLPYNIMNLSRNHQAHCGMFI